MKRMAHEPSDEHRARLRSLQALALNTSTVLWHAAPDGTVLQPNPSWEAFTGQDYAAYAGWNWVSAIHPDDRAACIDAWRAATRDRTLFEHRYRLLRRDGSYRAMQVQGTPVLEGGTLREWVGVCVDITEQLQAQSALRESEAVFRFLDRLGQATRQLTEAADVMQATARLLGEHLGATRCAYADVEPDGDTFTIRSDWSMPGVPSSAGMYSLQLFGRQAVERLHRGEHLVVRDVDRELGSEGGGRMFNAIGIQAIICAGLVKQGRLVAMMAVHQAAPRDWTEREIALVEEVVDRCWAHIERVRDAAMLREQDRRKDLFLATLAHELRNPLAPVKYALEILRRADDPDKVQRARDAIDRQVTQMARLIDDLLDLSRINRGLIRLQPRPQALGALLQEALDAVQPAIEAARHTLRFAPPADDVVVDADATRMVQVFGNLLGNAAKYTPEGGTITVDVAADAHAVLVEISDTGLGIPAGQEQRVFGMFEQLEHTAAHAKGGLGIGLARARAARAWAAAQPSPCGGRARRRTPRRPRRPRPPRKTGPRRCGSRWSRTTRMAAPRWRTCCSWPATTWSRPATARPGSSWWCACGPMWCCWTWVCRCWTVSRSRGASAATHGSAVPCWSRSPAGAPRATAGAPARRASTCT
jgi:PAS domain S-box-containing protein